MDFSPWEIMEAFIEEGNVKAEARGLKCSIYQVLKASCWSQLSKGWKEPSTFRTIASWRIHCGSLPGVSLCRDMSESFTSLHVCDPTSKGISKKYRMCAFNLGLYNRAVHEDLLWGQKCSLSALSNIVTMAMCSCNEEINFH